MVQQVPPPIYAERDAVGEHMVGESVESSSSLLPDGVLKVEGVEEMQGRVLQNSMVLLSPEYPVMNGKPMSLVLTLALEDSPEAAHIVFSEQLAGLKMLRIGIAGSTRSSYGVSNGSHIFCREWNQQRTFGSGLEDLSTCPSRAVQVASISVTPFCEDSSGLVNQGSTPPPSGSLDAAGLHIGLNNQSTACRQFKLVDLSFCENKPVVGRIGGHWVEEMIDTTHDDLAVQLVHQAEGVRELETSLAAAELEKVELKIEIEDLRTKMETYGDLSQNDTFRQMEQELQRYRNKCEQYQDEIHLLLDQFPSSAEILQKERRLVEVMEENHFLQGCLAKAKKHVLRSKAWRDELRKWKDIENTRRDASAEPQAVSFHESRTICSEPRIENKGGVLRQSESLPVHLELPPCVQNCEGNMKECAKPARAALRVLDSNTRNDFDLHNYPKRRRQLQFPGAENFNKANPRF